MSTEQVDREDPLRRRAYQLWENDGMRDGEDLRYWQEAEKEAARAKAAERAKVQSSAPGTVTKLSPSRK
jgi:hypothetical protein